MHSPDRRNAADEYVPAVVVDEAVEYIDYLPANKVTAEVSQIWRLLDKHATTRQSRQELVLAALRDALGSAVDNLPDVAGDPMFGADETAACCADIAALRQLLAPDENGQANILAYL